MWRAARQRQRDLRMAARRSGAITTTIATATTTTTTATTTTTTTITTTITTTTTKLQSYKVTNATNSMNANGRIHAADIIKISNTSSRPGRAHPPGEPRRRRAARRGRLAAARGCCNIPQYNVT